MHSSVVSTSTLVTTVRAAALAAALAAAALAAAALAAALAAAVAAAAHAPVELLLPPVLLNGARDVPQDCHHLCGDAAG